MAPRASHKPSDTQGSCCPACNRGHLSGYLSSPDGGLRAQATLLVVETHTWHPQL